MPEGGELGLVLKPAPEAVEIRIEDTGSGVPPDALGRIFDPFFTSKAQGTGLGLAIVQRVVEAHGGSVAAENRPGGGAAFRILLPAGKGSA